MAKIPEREDTTVNRIYKWHEEINRAEESRGYLGASVIGSTCARALWYSFRWCTPENTSFPGSVLRLFQYGHSLEERLAEELIAAGCELHTHNSDGEQFGFSDLGGHFRGHMDGAISGLAEAPKTWHVWECKSHNDKSFTDLEKNGVEKSKPQHYAQMQIYMHWSGMKRAFYLAENKNNSRLYSERIEYDKAYAEQLIRRASTVIFSSDPPGKISDSPAYYVCKFCDFNALCHCTNMLDRCSLSLHDAVPAPSCRTCCHSTPRDDGDARWECTKHACDIPIEHARDGCEDHIYMPIFIGDVSDANQEENWIEYSINDNKIKLGTRSADVFSSKEVYQVRGEVLSIFDDKLREVRKEFDAEIEGK